MSPECPRADLEALVLGELDAAQAHAIEAHAGACATCADELAWLRAERELLARRAGTTPSAAPLWPGIAARLPAARPPRGIRWGAPLVTAAVMAAAAAVMLLVLGSHPRTPTARAPLAPHDAAVRPVAAAPASAPRRDPDAALDHAEREYQRAITVLESELSVAKRGADPALVARLDAHLAKGLRDVSSARAAAGRDPEARLAVLDGYALYVRSLETVVASLSEVNR